MMTSAPMSPNLALNEEVARRRERGETIVHLGFGENGLPVFEPLMRVLCAGAHRGAYGPVAGAADAREAVAGYFTRRRLPTGADQIVLGPGSKPLLQALFMAVPGDVLLPKPCWNSYAPQTRLAGKIPLWVPIPPHCGGIPEPQAMRETLAAARARGADPRIVVLTLPDNPTGTLADPATVAQVCAIAEREDLTIISDEIYRDVMHDPRAAFQSPAELVPQRTVITTGLSKSLAVGGWRIGTARLPRGAAGKALRDRLVGIASDVWSTLAGPMQQVATYAYGEPPEIRAHLAACARLHGAVARAVHRIAVGAGALCRPPTGAFYLYPDFEPFRDALRERGITGSASLATHMLERLGVAVLAGHLLGDDPGALRFKCATSQLYGRTPQQCRQALSGEDPVALPHIRDALARIAGAFTTLTGATIAPPGAQTMTDPTIRAIVTDTAADVLGVDADTLTAADRLTDLPTFNSFRIVEVVERLEERLDVELDPSDLVPANLSRLDPLCALFEAAR